MQIGPFSYDFASLPRPQFPRLLDEARRRSATLGSSLALSAKVALDRAASALRFAMSPSLSPQDWLRVVCEVGEARCLWEERGWIQAPETYHVEPPPLDVPILGPARSRGVNFRHLTFESGYEPHANEPGRGRWLDYRPNRDAHAWVFRHPGRPRPWLMCIHGYGLGLPFVDLEAFRVSWLHRRLGLNIILPVLPLHGPRRIGRQSGDGFFAGDVLDTIHAEAQTMWDLRRILSWVRTQEPVSVGVYGLSLGGYNAALMAALDADLACVIAGIPAADFIRLAQHHSRPSDLLLAKQAGLKWTDIQDIMRVVSPLALAPRVPHERRYIFGGRADCIVPPDQVRDLWQHWKRPRVVWYDGSHLSLPWESSVTALLDEAIGTALLQGQVPAEDRAVA